MNWFSRIKCYSRSNSTAVSKSVINLGGLNVKVNFKVVIKECRIYRNRTGKTIHAGCLEYTVVTIKS